MRPSFSFENSLGSWRLQPKKIVRRQIKQENANSVEYMATNTPAVLVNFNSNTSVNNAFACPSNTFVAVTLAVRLVYTGSTGLLGALHVSFE